MSIDVLGIVIVLYKCDLNESKSFQSLARIADEKQLTLDVYVHDNSPVSDGSSVKSENFKIQYSASSENVGVSKAYNDAAEFFIQKGKSWILLLDQDSSFTAEMLEEFLMVISNNDNLNIIAPRVINEKDNILYSPSYYKFKRGFHITSELKTGVNQLKGITFINSGLFIALSLFTKTSGYDERVQLYFSDFIFIERAKKYTKEYFLMESILMHQLSSNEASEIGIAMEKFKLYNRSSASASKVADTGAFWYFIWCLIRGIKLSLKFRQYNFITVPFKTFFG